MAQILSLVQMINTDQLSSIRELTANILDNCLYDLSILYRLIFHTYKTKPDAACQMLTGFIQFGQSPSGTAYKPMLDYFVIEAFTGLFKIGGWTVVKPCVMALRDANNLNDSLFKHILLQILAQLKEDEKDKDHSSNLCFNLPREKSFSWGWFSYDLARAYYGKNEPATQKQMRKYMMLYRKLLTDLRKADTHNEVEADTHVEAEHNEVEAEPAKIPENWADLLNVLQEYKWASDLIEKTMPEAAAACANACESAAANACEAAVAANEVANEVAANEVANEVVANEVAAATATTSETAANEVVANEVAAATATTSETAANEVVANEVAAATATTSETVACANEVAPEPAKEKNNSWLSWFGMA